MDGGERATVVQFQIRNLWAAVAGFGLWFIDPDWPDWPAPGMGACTVTAYDALGRELFAGPVVRGPSASQVFCGVVAVDSTTHLPTPAIARLVIHAGSGWPASASGEGATMDDFMFGAPEPLVQFVRVVLQGSTSSLGAGGPPGTVLRLQCTKDLGAPDWQDVGTRVIGENCEAAFADLPVSEPRLFYRLVTP